jgi:uncharacterized protein involved in response to NO
MSQPAVSVLSPPSTRPRGLPLLRLGFRPVYLGAAAFACIAVPLWIALLFGRTQLPLSLPPLLWHAHEMLFGFAVAVVVGFLLTAGKAWTGLETPRGAFLGALAALWLAARVAAIIAPYPLYAVLDLVLLPVVAALFVDVLVRARNRRNLPLAGILVLLSVANLLFHLSVLGTIGLAPVRALYAALALIVLIECVMAGRVVPLFTANATGTAKAPPRPRLEAVTIGASALALLAWVADASGSLPATLFLLAAALHVVRQWRWKPWITRGRPILWILHASYAWIPVGFALLALAQLGWLPTSAGVHALAVGATAGLIIGMMTRTARGHTGRPLRASKAEVAAYLLVMAAAVARVLLPLAAPALTAAWLTAAAFAWAAAFALYLVVYAPWLLRTRLDGKDG